MSASRNHGIHLVRTKPANNRARAKVQATVYSAADVVPETAIYTVVHADHPLPLAVTLRRGASFPACSACDAPVEFRYLRAAARDDAARFHVVLHALPVLDEAEAQQLPRPHRLLA
jgi:hypothetical protein